MMRLSLNTQSMQSQDLSQMRRESLPHTDRYFFMVPVKTTWTVIWL